MIVLFAFVLLSLLLINVLVLPIELLNAIHPSGGLLGAIALVVLAWCLDD